MTEDVGAPGKNFSFARLISTCITARLLVDIGVQMFNPFLPIFAAGMGTSVVVMGRLVSLRSSMGLLAPLFGTLADRFGYRLVMRGALILGALGLFLVGVGDNLALAALGMVLSGLGLAGFVPTLQAYLSARLPYTQRARGLGMVEYSWALTGIIGLSLMGQLIAVAGWRAPFFVLSAGMVVMAAVLRVLPTAREYGPERAFGTSEPRSAHLWLRIRQFFDLGPNAASAYGCIFGAGFLFYAGMQIMITYGAWLNDRYALGPRELGMVALVFGLFDLTASVSVSIFTDQYGKKRSVLLGSTGALVGYLLLPVLDVTVLSAVLGIGIARGFFEFAIVSNFPLLSEQVPNQRGKVLTLSAAFSLSGATLANFAGPAIYIHLGLAPLAVISSASTAIAILLFRTRVNEIE